MRVLTIFLFFLFTTSLFSEAGGWGIGAEANYSGYLKLDNYSHGAGVGFVTTYNLTDFWGVTGSLNYNKHFSGSKYDIVNGYFGFLYNLDVLRLVPIFEAGISFTGLKNNELNDNMFIVNGYLGFALSYLINWNYSIATFIRYEHTLTEYEDAFDAYFTIGLRFFYIFGD